MRYVVSVIEPTGVIYCYLITMIISSIMNMYNERGRQNNIILKSGAKL